jgi:hypothetical protein
MQNSLKSSKLGWKTSKSLIRHGIAGKPSANPYRPTGESERIMLSLTRAISVDLHTRPCQLAAEPVVQKSQSGVYVHAASWVNVSQRLENGCILISS